MKRGGGPKRKMQSLREWQERSRATALAREAAKRLEGGAPSSLSRSDGLGRGKGPGTGSGGATGRKQRPAPVGPLTPKAWRDAVWALDHGRSIVSGTPVRREDGLWAWQAHHPVPKRHLPPHLKYDPRNGVVLLRLEHLRHEARFVDRERRSHVVPLEKLPQRVLDFAAELGPEAVALLHQQHPPAGAAGEPDEEAADE